MQARTNVPTSVTAAVVLCVFSARQMKMMLQSTDAIPMNFGFTGKGNTAKPEGLKEVKEATTAQPSSCDSWFNFSFRESSCCQAQRSVVQTSLFIIPKRALVVQ